MKGLHYSSVSSMKQKKPTHHKCYSEVHSISHSACHIEIDIIFSYEIQILLVVEGNMTADYLKLPLIITILNASCLRILSEA